MAKQHKYIYRKFINGKWRYWYKEGKNKKDLSDMVDDGKKNIKNLLDRLLKRGLHAEEKLNMHFSPAENVRVGYFGKTFTVGQEGKTVTGTKKLQTLHENADGSDVFRTTANPKTGHPTSFNVYYDKPRLKNKNGTSIEGYKALKTLEKKIKRKN